MKQTLSEVRPLSKKTLFALALKGWPAPIYEAAMKTFNLLALAFRPLSTHELCDLVVSSKDSEKENLLEILDSEEIATCLPGIVTTSSNEIAFSRRSLRAYLLSKDVWGSTPFLDEHQLAISHGDIAELCIRYLISPHARELLDSQGNLDSDHFPIIHSPLNFLSYAVQH